MENLIKDVTPEIIQSYRRGNAEYFQQHNYRELYGLMNNLLDYLQRNVVSDRLLLDCWNDGYIQGVASTEVDRTTSFQDFINSQKAATA